jgi:hypothetical protein
VLLVTLSVRGQKASCHAVIDSGSDRCLFPASMLRKLELNAETLPLEVASGVGSVVTTHYADLSIEIRGVATFPARAGFTAGLDDWGLGVLGQVDFFERFRVLFDYAGGYFNIETK